MNGWESAYDPWLAEASPFLERLQARRDAGIAVYPPDPLRALRLTPLSKCRVVILGQDPYHGPGQAEGLAFSVPIGVKPPPSLRNILNEVVRDCAIARPAHGSLVSWAERGALLLNTVLTVEDGRPGAHAKWGWESLTDRLIRLAVSDPAPKVFLLWGAHAQAKRPLIESSSHLMLCANHPSPLSALRPPVPFAGCAHFSQAQAWLQARGVEWSWAITLPMEKPVL
jgi:uracil-DNA glycosylase